MFRNELWICWHWYWVKHAFELWGGRMFTILRQHWNKVWVEVTRELFMHATQLLSGFALRYGMSANMLRVCARMRKNLNSCRKNIAVPYIACDIARARKQRIQFVSDGRQQRTHSECRIVPCQWLRALSPTNECCVRVLDKICFTAANRANWSDINRICLMFISSSAWT